MANTEIVSSGGYMIPISAQIEGGDAMVCIICHGFASSKASSTAQMMAAHCRSMGIGAAAFDFPCHGQSSAPFESLTVDRCLEDLQAVEHWVKTKSEHAEIVYFGSSFGAYVVLCHLCSGQSLGKRAFLRCAAVDMDRSFGVKTPEVLNQTSEKGHFLYDPGFGPGLKLSEAFFDSLGCRDLFAMDLPQGAVLSMIHGMCDDVVSPDEARRYAALKGVPITMIPDTGHSIDSKEGIEALLRLTGQFYCTKPQ